MPRRPRVVKGQSEVVESSPAPPAEPVIAPAPVAPPVTPPAAAAPVAIPKAPRKRKVKSPEDIHFEELNKRTQKGEALISKMEHILQSIEEKANMIESRTSSTLQEVLRKNKVNYKPVRPKRVAFKGDDEDEDYYEAEEAEPEYDENPYYEKNERIPEPDERVKRLMNMILPQ